MSISVSLSILFYHYSLSSCYKKKSSENYIVIAIIDNNVDNFSSNNNTNYDDNIRISNTNGNINCNIICNYDGVNNINKLVSTSYRE